MPYIANTQKDRDEMLKTIGVSSVEELWQQTGVPSLEADISGLPDGRSEMEVIQYFSDLASRNKTNLSCFLGGGYYDHYTPAAVGDVVGRGEFLTAYTPYQPEVSQGTLQAIFEWQSSICRITGMEVSNASMYDGGTALFECILMSIRQNKRNKVVVAGGLSPIYSEMIHCYNVNLGIELVEIPMTGCVTDTQKILDAVDGDTTCVVVQYPNFFGEYQDWSNFNTELKAKDKKVMAVCSCYPTALALLKTPGEMGFDIVSGEAQCLGLPLAFGGPYLGFMATTNKLMRKMPGRICGKTVDADGREAYVLTLQAREQHIRREKANSNICSNQGLCALSATIYLALMGEEGFKEVAQLSASKAAYTRELLGKVDGVTLVTGENYFNEFVIETTMDANDLVGELIEKGFAGGYPLGKYFPERKNQILIAVTEKRTKEEIKGLATAVEAILC